jgi:hypothetical protein
MALQDGSQPVSARGRFYVKCAANAVTALTESTTGGTGKLGDEIDWLWIFPTTTTPGAVTLSDGGTSVWPWPGGITLADIRPIFVPLNIRSQVGGWTVTTPAGVTVLASGAFS